MQGKIAAITSMDCGKQFLKHLPLLLLPLLIYYKRCEQRIETYAAGLVYGTKEFTERVYKDTVKLLISINGRTAPSQCEGGSGERGATGTAGATEATGHCMGGPFRWRIQI